MAELLRAQGTKKAGNNGWKVGRWESGKVGRCESEKCESMKVVLIFDHFGPYHVARAKAAAREMDLTCIELHGKSRSYGWESASKGGLPVTSLPETGARGAAERRRLEPHLAAALREARPDVVAINGWNDFMSMESLRWCVRNGVPAIVMSETTPWDEPRVWHREFIKGRMVRMFSAGLAGGTPQRDYLVQLGLPESAVELGYDAVDNVHFAHESAKWRTKGLKDQRTGTKGAQDQRTTGPMDQGLEDWRSGDRGREGSEDLRVTSNGEEATPYFLASARFIPKKNLGRLIEAYATYRRRSMEHGAWSGEKRAGEVEIGDQRSEIGGQRHDINTGRGAWDLVLLGDGDMRAELLKRARDLGLEVREGAPWEESEANSSKVGKWEGAKVGRWEGGMVEKWEGGKVERSEVRCQRTEGGGRRAEGPRDQRTKGLRDQRTDARNQKAEVSGQRNGVLWLPGFRQIDELPRFYACAGCFIHASTTEQWGLVVNEAMACGLPVIVSERCGCAQDLVQDGVNGFRFDPLDTERLAELMATMSGTGFDLRGFGAASRKIIANWGPERFGEGFKSAAQTAMRAGPARAGVADRLLLEILCRR